MTNQVGVEPLPFSSISPRGSRTKSEARLVGDALRYLQSARYGGRFEPAGEVDGVAPHVEGEFPATNDAGHDRADVKADPHLPATAGAADDVEHFEAKVGAAAEIGGDADGSSPATAM